MKNQSLSRNKILSVSQILARIPRDRPSINSKPIKLSPRGGNKYKLGEKKIAINFNKIASSIKSQNKKALKPIIPPKSFLILLKEKPEKVIYNSRMIDYKHCGLLQKYIGLGGKILPRRQTKLTAKQQRYIAKTIKSARILGLLPFVTKEKGFFR